MPNETAIRGPTSQSLLRSVCPQPSRREAPEQSGVSLSLFGHKVWRPVWGRSGCAALHHAREPLRERAWVRGKLPVQDLGLIQQQVRGVLPERLRILAKVRQGDDQLVLRIELQDRLRGRRAQLP